MASPSKPGKKEPVTEVAVPGAFLTVLGLLFLAIWLWEGYHNLFRPLFLFEKTECRIEKKEFSPASKEEPGGLGFPVFDFKVLARGSSYRAQGYDFWKEGISRAKAEKIFASFNVEESHPCWFDPADPSQAVLDRTPDTYWILCGVFLILPLNALGAFMLFAAWRMLKGLPPLQVGGR